ncbi:DEAD/DEAH box helicase family protein, partial [Paenibacillus pasadenensis]|uniref:helicase-related protein n=1 Tax=Paenibacillus pasadenensis TaxID=217090 RepID=UPI002040D1B5
DAALQLAALLGRLRLGSAVAAGQMPRRKGGFAAHRCQRCGSGEAQLLRTACAACGSGSCACCQACLAMGRSRECGLLVLGMPAQGWQGASLALPQAQSPAAARLRRWGLSPAQSAAAAAALAFLEQPAEKADSPVRSVEWPAEKAGSPVRSLEQPSEKADPAVRSIKQPTNIAEPSACSIELPARTAFPSTASMAQALCTVNKRPQSKHLLMEVAGAFTCLYRSLTMLVKHSLPAAKSFRQAGTGLRPVFLLWAVTGAGKTEMVFPLLESVLQRGGKALLATPRRDVVLELEPRLRKAFPNVPLVTLYGGSPQRWENGSLFLATTHQLLRFREAFDLVLIDELDAFPFVNDELLHAAAARSAKTSARVVLLTATPTQELRRMARRGLMPHAKVPVRFHRKPLPVPRQLRSPSVPRMLAAGRLPRRLVQALLHSLERGAQVFLFLPSIRDVQPLVLLLDRLIPAQFPVAGTHSQDSERMEKVKRFRELRIRLLVTTTILERGVTVPRSDVFIFDADSEVFGEASLVQASGRAGRSADDPHGRVWFVSAEASNAQKQAIRQITAMNRAAQRGGYLQS